MSDAPQFSHLDEHGRASMVDVGAKDSTRREARAEGRIMLQPTTLRQIVAGALPKGDVLAVARVAGIMAAKRTAELIPLCHQLPLTFVGVEFTPDEQSGALHIVATARCTGQTGVEMEALTAVSIAALTIYDMCKAVDTTMHIEGIGLVSKTGGKHDRNTMSRED